MFYIHVHRQNNVDLAIVLCGRDRKKDFAPNHSAYYPFGVDVFLSPRKVDHIARFVELPVISSSGKFPPILVVNVQVHSYFVKIVILFGLLAINCCNFNI